MYRLRGQALLTLGVFLLLSVAARAQMKDDHKGATTKSEYFINPAVGPDDTVERTGEPGISLSTTLAMDVMGAISGGRSQKAIFVENWHVNLSMDPEPYLGLKNSLIHLSSLQNNGGAPSDHIGDVQVASNIEAVQTLRIYEAWIQQNMMDNRLSLLAGVYDINSEFDVMQSAQLFLNSSQGIGAELASSGLTGPSTFPATGLAARLKMMPLRNLYAQFAVVDGSPGTRHVEWEYGSDGIMAIGEIGVLIKMAGNTGRFSSTADRGDHIGREVDPEYDIKLAVGGWGYNRNFADRRYNISIASYKNETGLYLFADVRSLSWIDSRFEDVSWHARVGIANDDLSRFHYYFGSGITVDGLIAGQPSAHTGISVSIAENSDIYESQLSMVSKPEIAWELTHQIPVAKWLSLQPDVQYIINPGAAANLDNAWVVGLRSTVTL